jgi:hypothetical protein
VVLLNIDSWVLMRLRCLSRGLQTDAEHSEHDDACHSHQALQSTLFSGRGNVTGTRAGRLPLATFGQRVLGYAIDLLLAILLWAPSEITWRILVLHEKNVHVAWDFHEIGNLVFMLLYFGLFNYVGNGQTPGKWMARTRAVSLTSRRIGESGSPLRERWGTGQRCWRAAWASSSIFGVETICALRIVSLCALRIVSRKLL